MPEDLEGAQPQIVAELVAYLIKPEAYFVTGESCLLITHHTIVKRVSRSNH